MRRQPGGTADHPLKGEVTGINTRAVISGGDVSRAFKKALEHVAGHHSRGVVTRDGVFAQQQASIEHAFELADLYLKLNLIPHFEQLTRRIIEDDSLPPELILRVGQMYADAKRFDLLTVALQKYLAREPSNPRIWIDLAAAQIQIQRTNEAMESLKQAIARGGEPVRDIARNDRRFDPVRQDPHFLALVPTLQTRVPLPLPGM